MNWSYFRSPCVDNHSSCSTLSTRSRMSVTRSVRRKWPPGCADGETWEIDASWTSVDGRMRAHSAKLIALMMPHCTAAPPAYYIAATANAADDLARYAGVSCRHGIAGSWE